MKTFPLARCSSGAPGNPFYEKIRFLDPPSNHPPLPSLTEETNEFRHGGGKERERREKRRILPNRNEGEGGGWIPSPFRTGPELFMETKFFRRLVHRLDSSSQSRPLICPSQTVSRVHPPPLLSPPSPPPFSVAIRYSFESVHGWSTSERRYK